MDTGNPGAAQVNGTADQDMLDRALGTWRDIGNKGKWPRTILFCILLGSGVMLKCPCPPGGFGKSTQVHYHCSNARCKVRLTFQS